MWQFLGMMAAVVVVPAALYQTWVTVRDRHPRRLVYGLTASVPMLAGPHSARVTLDGVTVQNPNVVTVRLAHRGSKDIAPGTFSMGPMRLELGTPILEILNADPGSGTDGPIPHATSPGATALLIGPCVIRARQQTTWTLLTDGPASNLTCHDRPLDVHATRQDAPEPSASDAKTMMRMVVATMTVAMAAAMGAEVVGTTATARWMWARRRKR